MNKLILLTLTSILSFNCLVAEIVTKPFNSDFEVLVSKRCMFGDLDAINYEMMYAQKPKLLLSFVDLKTQAETTFEFLEEFYNNEKYDQVAKEKTVKQLFEGNYPASSALSQDGLYAIQICSDLANTNSCLNKSVTSINKVLETYNKPPKNYRNTEDKVYFFQLVAKKGEELMYSKKPVGEKSFLQAVSDWKIKGYSVANADLTKLSVLGSMPLKDGNTIELPIYDQEKCGQ